MKVTVDDLRIWVDMLEKRPDDFFWINGTVYLASDDTKDPDDDECVGATAVISRHAETGEWMAFP